VPNAKVSHDKSMHNFLEESHKDWLAEMVKFIVQMVMEYEVEGVTRAKHGERTPERLTHRNGYRERLWKTRVGDVLLNIPKVREGTFYPSFLEPRRRAEKALTCLLNEAYVQGVSTRRVEKLCQELGVQHMDRNAVSRITKELSEAVEEFRTRRLETPFPYLYIDARYETVRDHGRMVKKAVLVAVGVRADGHREVLGFTVGASESGELWEEFLHGLVERGLHGVKLVISDAHKGIQRAVSRVFLGASWQWCKVHFLRALTARIANKKRQQPIISLVKTIFDQTSIEDARKVLHDVVIYLEKIRPDLARFVETAEAHILTYMTFPPSHWTKLHSTNMIERLMRTIKARTRIVSIFPDDGSLLRLVGAILIEENDEWTEAKRYISEQEMTKLWESVAAPASLSADRRMIPNTGMAA